MNKTVLFIHSTRSDECSQIRARFVEIFAGNDRTIILRLSHQDEQLQRQGFDLVF